MGSGIRVLLAYANSPMDNLIPIGPSILSSCLKEAGHDVRLFDTTFYRTRKVTGDESRVKTLQVNYTDLSELGIVFKETGMVGDFKKLVDEYRPALVGISCVEPTLDIALALLHAIKDYKAPKVLGGMGVMFFRDGIFNEGEVEIVCVGEGEEAIVELADAIRDNVDYHNIPNLWVRQNGGVIKNNLRPLVDINTLPFQDWSIYEQKRFLKPMGGRVWRMGAFEFARGCPRMCTYCCNYGINQFYHGRYFRRKRVDRIIAEIKHAIENYHLEYLYFYAENFLLMGEEEFINFTKEYSEIGLPFWIETEPESLTEERLRSLKMVGCEGISVGVEHGNEEFRRKTLNRSISNEALMRAFGLARKSGMRISANNIIGFPTETRELIFDTINLNRELCASNIIVNLFNPYRGTRLREVAIEKGLLDEHTNGGDYRTSTTLDQPQLTKDELMGLHRTFVLYVLLPKSRWGLIRKAEKFNEEGSAIFEELSKELQDWRCQ